MTKYKKRMKYGNVEVVMNKAYQYAVLDSEGNEIVPFGKYAWIEGFDSGLCRVRSKGKYRKLEDNLIMMIIDHNMNCTSDREVTQALLDQEYKEHPEYFVKWGIINKEGEEVVPVEYDSVWKFFEKNRRSTSVERDGFTSTINFSDLPGSDYYVEKNDEPEPDYGREDYFDIDRCYDEYGNFDVERLEDAILDEEYVPEDW